MLDSVGWLPLAIIGALVYGSYSLMLMMVHDKIKKDKIASRIWFNFIHVLWTFNNSHLFFVL